MLKTVLKLVWFDNRYLTHKYYISLNEFLLVTKRENTAWVVLLEYKEGFILIGIILYLIALSNLRFEEIKIAIKNVVWGSLVILFYLLLQQHLLSQRINKVESQ